MNGVQEQSLDCNDEAGIVCGHCGASLLPPHRCDSRRLVLKCPECGRVLLRYNAAVPGSAENDLPPFLAGRTSGIPSGGIDK